MQPTPTSTLNGLSEQEARARRAQGLGNNVTFPSSRSYLLILRENVFTFINIVIFGLGVFLVLLGHTTDALVSVGVIFINIFVSVFQEIRAKQTLDQIALITRPSVTVVRDGARRKLDRAEIVVGDILVLETGDQIVADGSLLGGQSIQVDEGMLSGESDPITRQPGEMLYSGSFCVSGSGYYRAEQVGAQSLSNKLAASARAFRRIQTPIQKQVNLIVRVLLLVALYLEVLLLVNSVVEKIPLVEGVRMAIVVVGLVPNGLFLAIATTYAISAVRIARKGALVQQSNAIESLSHVDVLCLDKTGTLTTNQLKLHSLLPVGISEAQLRDALGAFAASFLTGNRTAAAIAEACPGASRPARDSVPFSSSYRWSGMLFEDGAYVLGAPETLLPGLSAMHELAAQIEAWNHQGLRVLAFSHSAQAAALRDQQDAPQLPPGLQPIGLIAIADELRPEARATIDEFRKAGVELKIISGDNPETVAALARQAGFSADEEIVSGIELARLKPDELSLVVATRAIFGRVTPQLKEQMIQSLTARGKFVAMIGDGVNDVLALKKANLAISMQSGSQAARAVADIVLLDNSFAVLPQAVLEGQRILVGMQYVFKIYLTRILYVALLILSTAAAGGFPMGPKHSSILSLLTVGIPTIALAAWASPGRVSRDNAARGITRFVLPAGLTLGLLGLGVFVGFLLIPAVLSGTFSFTGSFETEHASAFLNTAQTALTTFSIFCGLLLVLFVVPPTRFWIGAERLRGDMRPVSLVLALFASYLLILVIPALRKFFELAALEWYYTLGLFVLALFWALWVRSLWRTRSIERFLSLG